MSAARLTILLAVLAVAAATAWAARPAPPTPEERVERIVAELRCPVCQGLSVADSPSETARAMRDLVAQRVAEGRSDTEIRDEFRRSYGDWVLLSPAIEGPAALMWLLPVLLVALGGVVAWSRARGAPAPAPDAPAPLVAELRERARREEADDR